MKNPYQVGTCRIHGGEDDHKNQQMMMANVCVVVVLHHTVCTYVVCMASTHQDCIMTHVLNGILTSVTCQNQPKTCLEHIRHKILSFLNRT